MTIWRLPPGATMRWRSGHGSSRWRTGACSRWTRCSALPRANREYTWLADIPADDLTYPVGAGWRGLLGRAIGKSGKVGLLALQGRPLAEPVNLIRADGYPSFKGTSGYTVPKLTAGGNFGPFLDPGGGWGTPWGADSFSPLEGPPRRYAQKQGVLK